MRTTLTLDDDIATYARAHARRERIPLGEAVSRLARDGIKAQGQSHTMLAQPKSRYAVLPARSEVITTEHVRALMDQEGL